MADKYSINNELLRQEALSVLQKLIARHLLSLSVRIDSDKVCLCNITGVRPLRDGTINLSINETLDSLTATLSKDEEQS